MDCLCTNILRNLDEQLDVRGLESFGTGTIVVRHARGGSNNGISVDITVNTLFTVVIELVGREINSVRINDMSLEV